MKNKQCVRCKKGSMRDGIALVNRYSASPYMGDILVYYPSTKADLKPCKKCDNCGHSEF